jgi:hypothetical protein
MKAFVLSFLLSLILVFASLSSSLAQLTVSPEFGFGILSQKIQWGDESPSDLDVHLQANRTLEMGGTLTYTLPMLGLQTGLLLHNRGSVLSSSETYLGERYTGKIITRITYLEIPLGVQISPLANKDILLEGGIALATALTGDFTTKTNFAGERERDNDPIAFDDSIGSLKRGDFRLYAGGRIQVPGQNLQVGGRLSLGLTNIENTPEDVMRNYALTIFVAWPFELGKK